MIKFNHHKIIIINKLTHKRLSNGDTLGNNKFCKVIKKDLAIIFLMYLDRKLLIFIILNNNRIISK